MIEEENKRCIYLSKQLYKKLVERSKFHKLEKRELLWKLLKRDEVETQCDKCGKAIEKDPIILCEDCYNK